MKIGFISLGCSKNLVDSEYIIGLFQDGRFEFENDPRECDVIVINTCGFILDAKKEAIDTILEMAEYKKDKLKKLIVCGCFVERYLEDCLNEFPEVDAFVPISDYPKFPQILEALFEMEFDTCFREKRVMITNPYYAYLKISDGCDNRCAYCAIPLIRGNCKSYPIEELVIEAKRLYDLGVRELNLVAQDTTYYGHDLYGYFALKDLLKELDEIPFHWIRILYMYPDEIEDELLEVMQNCKRVLPYFDIPIQYGNDRLLKLMNRRGSVELIRQRVNKIRAMFKEATIRTTLIVGFPYETEESFEDTLNLVKELKFDSLGAFTYSHEDDTKAFEYPDDIPQSVKDERYRRLMETQKAIVEEKNQKLIGQELEVFIERYEELFNRFVGRSKMSAPDGIDGIVYIDPKEKTLKVGEFYTVKVYQTSTYDLYAEVLD